MMPKDLSPRLYQVDKTATGLIIHNYGVAGETVAPELGEPPLTWDEAHLILLAGVTEIPANQTYSFRIERVNENPVSFSGE